MDTWDGFNFFDFSIKTRAIFIAAFILFNILLYFSLRNNDFYHTLLHKILSILNIIAESFIFIICLYQVHLLFIIFTPFIIAYLIFTGYGFTAQLSEEDKMMKIGGITIPSGFNSTYFKIICFPGYYLIKSWKGKL